jgi:hypothetical protein
MAYGDAKGHLADQNQKQCSSKYLELVTGRTAFEELGVASTDAGRCSKIVHLSNTA